MSVLAVVRDSLIKTLFFPLTAGVDVSGSPRSEISLPFSFERELKKAFCQFCS